MPWLTLADADIFYEVRGAGPALVFAHGLGGCHASWWQQVGHFAGRYTCVTFSHRGFAPSRDRGGAGARAFVDDLAALVEHLGLAEVRLVGQSMGGWTCLGYALRSPARVRGLVLACTTGPVTTPEIDASLATMAPREAATRERGAHPAAGERMLREQPGLHALFCGLDALGGADKASVRAQLLALRTVPAAALADLATPTLCVTGEEDAVIAPDAVAELARLLPRGRLARVEATGHSVYFERPAAFNGLVEAFLAELA